MSTQGLHLPPDLFLAPRFLPMLAIGVMLGSALGRALADLLASVPSVILVSGNPSPTGRATLSRLAPRTRCIRLIDYPGAKPSPGSWYWVL